MTARLRITGRDPHGGEGLAIGIEQGRIVSIDPAPAGPHDPYVSAGLIDVQVNGYAGHDLNDGALRPETVASLATSLRQCGVTTFIPTLITASDATITQALRAIQTARMADPVLAATIPFVHLEGPWIAPEDGPRGAHPLAYICPPDLAQFNAWAAAGAPIGLVTLSPHTAATPAVVRAMRQRDVEVAIGHTNASPTEIAAAVDAGARLSTHLGNGAAATLPRHPNVIWSQLGDDRLTATFIADGHHLPAETLRSMLRAKGLSRSILVSDCVALAGQPPGRYKTAVGGLVELSQEGRLSVADTPYLAGAVRPLKDNVALCATMAGLSLADVLPLATANPGRFVGGRGRLAIGERADLVRFTWAPGDDTLTLHDVFAGGVAVS